MKVHRALGFGFLMGLAACALQAGIPSAVQLAGRPLAFEENHGQTDGRVKFLSRGDGYSLFLTPAEAVLALRGKDSARTLRLRWEGAAPAPRVSGEGELPGRSHYRDRHRLRAARPGTEADVRRRRATLPFRRLKSARQPNLDRTARRIDTTGHPTDS